MVGKHFGKYKKVANKVVDICLDFLSEVNDTINIIVTTKDSLEYSHSIVNSVSKAEQNKRIHSENVINSTQDIFLPKPFVSENMIQSEKYADKCRELREMCVFICDIDAQMTWKDLTSDQQDLVVSQMFIWDRNGWDKISLYSTQEAFENGVDVIY